MVYPCVHVARFAFESLVETLKGYNAVTLAKPTLRLERLERELVVAVIQFGGTHVDAHGICAMNHYCDLSLSCLHCPIPCEQVIIQTCLIMRFYRISFHTSTKLSMHNLPRHPLGESK